MTAATRSTRRRRAPSAGRRVTPSSRRSRRRSAGTGPTRRGGGRCGRDPSPNTTTGSTRDESRGLCRAGRKWGTLRDMKGAADTYRGRGLIADPIHRYLLYTRPDGIPGEATEQDLIDTPWVQRLRRIPQLQSARWVFPAAEHSRFQHSLGVMHLSGRLAQQLYPSLKAVFPETPSLPLIEELLRVAGLLHDVGHGPCGHLFADNFPSDYTLTPHAARPPSPRAEHRRPVRPHVLPSHTSRHPPAPQGDLPRDDADRLPLRPAHGPAPVSAPHGVDAPRGGRPLARLRRA